MGTSSIYEYSQKEEGHLSEMQQRPLQEAIAEWLHL